MTDTAHPGINAESTPGRFARRPSRTPAKPKPGPPQASGDELAGTYIDRAVLQEFKKDPLGRDIFSVEGRIREWEATEELYERHRNAPLPIDRDVLHIPEYGVHLLGGDMGSGKTLIAGWIARHFRRRGWNVFSTAGFLFGQRLSLLESYAFPDHVTPGGFIFADEVHTFVDRYSASSHRSRTFGQASTAMRKQRITCLGASANSRMVGWEYKGACEAVIVPRPWYAPAKNRVAPPWCYLVLSMLSPFPYQSRDPLLQDAGLLKGHDIKLTHWNPNPIELIAAARLIDTFESVKLGENFDVSAGAMRGQRQADANGGKGEYTPDVLIGLVHTLWDKGHITQGKAASVSWAALVAMMKHGGVEGVRRPDLKTAFEIAGCATLDRGIRLDELTAFFGDAPEDPATCF